MNKKLLLLLPVLLLNSSLKAQKTADIGYATGVVHYIGDLANEKYFPFSAMGPGMQITVRTFLNNPERSHTLYKPFNVELRFSWHRLQYDETKPLDGMQGTKLRNYLRGLGFRNDLIGTSVNFTYTHYTNHFVSLSKQKFCYFILAGVGVFYGQPKADLFHGDINLANRYYAWTDGTIHDVAQNSGQQGNIIQKDGVYETNLRDWETEGQGHNSEIHNSKPYSLVNVGAPIGAGIRYGLNSIITLSAEVDYYLFLTDYLDDVSNRYATYSELAAAFPDPAKFELAKYISDPTGKGTDGTISQYTSPRGNPKMKDSFSFVSLEVSYNITWKKKEIYGQLAKN